MLNTITTIGQLPYLGLFIWGTSFLALFFLVYGILSLRGGKENSIERIEKYTEMEVIIEETRQAHARKDYRSGLSVIAKQVANIHFLDGHKRKVQKMLIRGHILLKPEEFITIQIIAACLFGLLGYLLLPNIIIALVALFVGWMVPGFFIASKVKKRIKVLNEQLGDAIVLISNSLKAGYSFFQAVDAVSKEMTGPIAEEFASMQREINLGATTEQALENMVDRVESDDLDMVMTAVMIQRQVGGNLAEVLDNISNTIRDRIKIKGDVRAITAQGRMSGLIIAVLPVGLGLILYMMNPEHISLLFTDKIGIAILCVSIVMEGIGIFFINKIVQIEI